MASVSRCPACGGRLRAWLRAPASDPILGEAAYELLRCERCGTAVTAGAAPAGMHETGAYRPGAPRLHTLARPVLSLFDRRRLTILRTLVAPPATVLDVGAGRGRFVAAARRAGYDASGIEPSSRGVQAAAAIGAPVIQAEIEHAEISPASVDAAVLWHVLEHLDEPQSALVRVHGWLRPGGALLLGVPNLASVQAQLGPRRWYHLDVPRHRVHFTPPGLNAVLERTGFTPVRTHHLLLEHNPFGMWQSLVNAVTVHPSYLYNLLKRNSPARSRDLPLTLAALALAPAAAIAELLAGALGRGGTIAVLARRRDG